MKTTEIKESLKVLNKTPSDFVACFTGYRPQKSPWGFNEQDERCKAMKEKAYKSIEKAILNGYYIFWCGMALGFDIICAEIVLELKEKYPRIKLYGALPCKNQSERWTPSQKVRYNNIYNQLDNVRCIYDHYIDGCMQERNQFMINNSSLVIALFDGKPGGTKQTLDYAKKQGLEIEIIKP